MQSIHRILIRGGGEMHRRCFSTTTTTLKNKISTKHRQSLIRSLSIASSTTISSSSCCLDYKTKVQYRRNLFDHFDRSVLSSSISSSQLSSKYGNSINIHCSTLQQRYYTSSIPVLRENEDSEEDVLLPEREVMAFDVLIVGGGPAGLAAAIRIKQLCIEKNHDLSVCVIDKGRYVLKQKKAPAGTFPFLFHISKQWIPFLTFLFQFSTFFFVWVFCDSFYFNSSPLRTK